jgi:hypothetical protein
MGQGLNDRFSGMTAGNARVALATAAAAVVVAVCAALAVAGVAAGEIVATALFLPVFVLALMGGRALGFLGAAVATAAYVLVRRADLSDAGGAAVALVLARGGAYAVAAHIGGVARDLTGASSPEAARPLAVEDRMRPRPRPAAAPRREPAMAGVGPGGGARDDSWDAVQESWRQQHGVPIEQSQGERVGYDQGGRHEEAGAWRAGDEDPAAWPSPVPPGGFGAPTASASGWPGAPGWQDGADENWRPPAHHDDAWQGGAGPGGWPGDQAGGNGGWPGDQAGGNGGWPGDQAGGNGGWPDQAGGNDNGWPAAGAGAGGWPGDQAADAGGWPGDQAGGNGGFPAEPGAIGGWPDQAGGNGAGGWPGDQLDDNSGWPADQAGGNGAGGWPAAPASDEWSGQAEGGWQAGPAAGEWPAAHAAGPEAGGWSEGRASGEWPAAHAAGNGWSQAPSTGEWPATGAWPPGSEDTGAAAGGWPAAPGNGQWPAAGDPGVGSWPPAPPSGNGWPTTGEWPAAGGAAPAPPGPPARPAGAALPAVDPETGLWTAKFLRDRLSSERTRSRRTHRAFSLVLVQVPDGPLATLPYRRQLTLLRELGYQFVAGGVVDHLVHVPDRSQHWFAVILPDTDRSGAQVLERRLRLGIRGYLSSRGLRLAELESASLTAPDDDPAMSEIWDALIGPDDAGDPSRAAFDR